MKKVRLCLIGCFLLALTSVRAQDAGKPGADSVIRLDPDTTAQTPAHSVISHDTATHPIPDTSFRYRGDTAAPVQPKDTVISLAGDPPAQTTPAQTPPAQAKDTTTDPKTAANTTADTQVKPDQQPAKDTATTEDKAEETKRELDPRWFISPLLKVQFQDFAMLEKNRKGYLSDANTLPFFSAR